MSIDVIRRIPDGAIFAVTKCDDCKAIIAQRPSHEGEFPGTSMMVANFCKNCSPRHSFPMDAPVHVVMGPVIGNPSSISKVRIEP